LVRDLLDRVGAEPSLVGAILDDGKGGWVVKEKAAP
jgi:hypothetical protein